MAIQNITFKGHMCKETVTTEFQHSNTDANVDKEYLDKLLGMTQNNVRQSPAPAKNVFTPLLDGDVVSLKTKNGEYVYSNGESIVVRTPLDEDVVSNGRSSISKKNFKTWSIHCCDEMTEAEKIFRTAITKVYEHLSAITKVAK